VRLLELATLSFSSLSKYCAVRSEVSTAEH
jgi:hypothetical protein